MSPPPIGQRLDVLLDALADLRRYRETIDVSRLRADRDAQNMVLRAMYVAAQAAIDLALHAGAARERGSVPTYQDAFDGLAEAGLVDAELAARLRGWAGLRNVLAHQYVAVDLERIATILREDLDDLERFAAIARAWTGPGREPTPGAGTA